MSPVEDAPRARWPDLALWAAQVLLALQFALAGAFKVFATGGFIGMNAWAADVPRPLLLGIGALEMAAAVGLVAPRATRIRPEFTAYAAVGLAALMAAAAVFRATRGEWGSLPVNVALGTLAGVVAYGRLRLVP